MKKNLIKKVLIVKRHDNNLRTTENVAYFLKEAFQDQGISDIDFYEFDMQVNRKLYHANRLARTVVDKDLVNAFAGPEKRFQKFLSKKRYDLIIFFKGEFVRKELLKKIRASQGAKIINIFHDNPLFYYIPYDAIAEYDHFFVKDTYVLSELEKAGFVNCHYLPQGCSPRYHKKVKASGLSSADRKRYSADISIIGSIYPHRQKILENLEGYDLKIWGKGIWPEVDRTSWILKKHQHEIVNGLEKSRVIACSKINLNTHNHQNDIFGTNSRTSEICICGGFQIVGYKKDIEKMYRIGKELVTFKTGIELKEKVDYYLKHPKERERIAQAGYRRAFKEHTYYSRVKEILKILKL